MVNYQTISALIDQIPADTWDVLREIKERRPAMMLLELIDCRRRALQKPERLNHDSKLLRTHITYPRRDYFEDRLAEFDADIECGKQAVTAAPFDVT